MRPLPDTKTHGIIHTVKAKQEDIDKLAETLNITAKDKARMRVGDEIHIVREAAPHELKKSQ